MSSMKVGKKKKEKSAEYIKKVRVGDTVDAKDAKGDWFEAKVHDLDVALKCVLVYFHGQDRVVQQWCDNDSLAPHRSHTSDAWRASLESGEARSAQVYATLDGGHRGWVRVAVKAVKPTASGRMVSLADLESGEVLGELDILSETLRADARPCAAPSPLPPSKEKAKSLKEEKRAAKAAAGGAAGRLLLAPHVKEKGLLDRRPCDAAGRPVLYFVRPFSARNQVQLPQTSTPGLISECRCLFSLPLLGARWCP